MNLTKYNTIKEFQINFKLSLSDKLTTVPSFSMV